MKNKRGITLISLVVTIVILVVLAGVAINLTVGENGLLRKAKLAKEEYNNAVASEEEQLNQIIKDCSDIGIEAHISTAYCDGGNGAIDLANSVIEKCSENSSDRAYGMLRSIRIGLFEIFGTYPSGRSCFNRKTR